MTEKTNQIVDVYLEIKRLIETIPNDMELGKLVRKVLNTHQSESLTLESTK